MRRRGGGRSARVADTADGAARAALSERGVATAGGITLTIDEENRFETFSYSDPEHRAWVQKVIEHTARNFDEVILDDFFFTNSKNEVEVRAKGDRSWPTIPGQSRYREVHRGRKSARSLLTSARATPAQLRSR